VTLATMATNTSFRHVAVNRVDRTSEKARRIFFRVAKAVLKNEKSRLGIPSSSGGLVGWWGWWG
jgi:hypothetical protein